MKKLIIAILELFILASFNLSAFADYSEGCLYYTIDNGSVTITGCFGNDSTITVPSAIAGCPVNTVATGAFIGHESLKTVNLPSTVITVQENAFDAWISVNYNSDIVLQPEPVQPIVPEESSPTVPPTTTDSTSDTEKHSSKQDDVSENESLGNFTSYSIIDDSGIEIVESEIDIDVLEASENVYSTPTPSPSPSPTPTASPSPSPEVTEEPTPEVTEEPTEENNSSAAVIIIIAAVVVIGAAAVIIAKKKKAQ